MELTDILSEHSVFCCDNVQDKATLLEVLSEQAAKTTGRSADTILESLSAREALGSTGLGNGIAIPHGKLAGLRSVSGIFASLEKPIDFDSVDDEPVDLVFMLLAPIGAGADHLKALARVARLLRTEALVEALRATDDARRLHQLLTAPLPSQDAA